MFALKYYRNIFLYYNNKNYKCQTILIVCSDCRQSASGNAHARSALSTVRSRQKLCRLLINNICAFVNNISPFNDIVMFYKEAAKTNLTALSILYSSQLHHISSFSISALTFSFRISSSIGLTT